MGQTLIRSCFLTDNGTQAGSENANVDGSVSSVDFFYQPSLWGHGSVDIGRLIITCEFTGAARADEYGGLTLTNGIHLHSVDSSGVETELDGYLQVYQAIDWARICYDFQVHTFGSGSNFWVANWNFLNTGIPLRLETDEKIVARIQDNLTTLVGHYFHAQGYEIRSNG